MRFQHSPTTENEKPMETGVQRCAPVFFLDRIATETLNLEGNVIPPTSNRQGGVFRCIAGSLSQIEVSRRRINLQPTVSQQRMPTPRVDTPARAHRRSPREYYSG